MLLVSPGRSAGSVSTSLFRLKAKPMSPEKTRKTPPIISKCGKTPSISPGRASEGLFRASVCPAFNSGTQAGL